MLERRRIERPVVSGEPGAEQGSDTRHQRAPSGARSWQAYRAQRYFTFLDGVRGIAVLGTVAHHVRNEPLAWMQGARGVTVFFVLSGFLITTLALREEDARGRLDLKGFLIRRSFRIFPLYYLVLLGYVVMVAVGLDDRRTDFVQALPYYALYLQEWPVFTWGRELPFALSWSLGVEEKFYLVWPALAFALLRRSPRRLPLALGLAAASVALSFVSPGEPQLFGSYAHILLGAALALLMHSRRGYERVAGMARRRVAPLSALAVVALWPVPLPNEVLFSLAVTFALAMLLVTQGRLAEVLSLRPLLVLGALSYAIYLTHNIALGVAEKVVPESLGTPGDLLTLVLGMLLVLPACWVLHRYFEQPLIEMGRRLSRGPAVGVEHPDASQRPAVADPPHPEPERSVEAPRR